MRRRHQRLHALRGDAGVHVQPADRRQHGGCVCLHAHPRQPLAHRGHPHAAGPAHVRRRARHRGASLAFSCLNLAGTTCGVGLLAASLRRAARCSLQDRCEVGEALHGCCAAQMTTRLRVTGEAAGPFRVAAQVLLSSNRSCCHKPWLASEGWSTKCLHGARVADSNEWRADILHPLHTHGEGIVV